MLFMLRYFLTLLSLILYSSSRSANTSIPRAGINGGTDRSTSMLCNRNFKDTIIGDSFRTISYSLFWFCISAIAGAIMKRI